ncbi:GatB/YqeY domain-containing protein [Alphaproteobacteria bacterium]|nr:GatB/YqeY domain-containing protein [Alphaproteobacteria bacterium]
MTIREEIKNNLKEAMIKKNVDLISALRLVIASIKDKDIIAKGKGNDSGINDEEIISLLQTMIKQRKSSIDMYLEGKREDLAKKEQNEIEIISKFLPKQLSKEEINNIIDMTIKSCEASSMKDMGKVINLLKNKHNGEMNLGDVSKIVKSKLTS